MADDFIQEIQAIVGPFLSELGFTVDEADSVVGEGGATDSVAFYRSRDCRIQIYHSSREGEINAMIAPLDAPNEYGPSGRSGKWHYFSDFTDMPDLSLEELVQKLREERANCDTTLKRLEWLKLRIARDFESAHAAIVASG